MLHTTFNRMIKDLQIQIPGQGQVILILLIGDINLAKTLRKVVIQEEFDPSHALNAYPVDPHQIVRILELKLTRPFRRVDVEHVCTVYQLVVEVMENVLVR